MHCEHNALTTIFERSTILSNNCGVVAHTQQPLSRRRGGTKAHQRTTISVGSHAFENFSAQALACEGHSLISRSDPPTGSTHACLHPTGAVETSTLADQVISTNTCKTPGGAPRTPLGVQPSGLCNTHVTCDSPGWVPGAPPKGEQPGLVVEGPIHAYYDQSWSPLATSPPCNNSATCILPGWVPGAPPKMEQPGSIDEALDHALTDQSRPHWRPTGSCRMPALKLHAPG